MKKIGLNQLNIYDIGNSLAISGFILAGKDDAIIVGIPEESDLPSKNISFLSLSEDEYLAVVKQLDVVDVEICTSDSRKKIVRKSQRQLDSRITWKVFERDNYKCRYCGISGVPLTYDHIMLWEDGGPTTIDNGVTACKKCNKYRGNTPISDWLQSDYYNKSKKGLSIEIRLQNDDLPFILNKVQRRTSKRGR